MAETLAEIMGMEAAAETLPVADGNTGATPPAMPEPVAPPPADPAAEAAATPAPSATSSEVKLYADKYKSPEELEKGHVNLEAKFREQAAELGAYRKMMEAQQQKQAQEQQAQPDLSAEFNQAVAQLDSQVDNLEITAEQYRAQREMLVANFAAAQAEAKVMARMTAEQEKMQEQQNRQQFAAENPQFVELMQTGELQNFLAENRTKLRLLDEVDAFYAYRAVKNEQMISELRAQNQAAVLAAREEGKRLALAELTTKAAGGENAAIASPPSSGQGMQTLPDKPMTLDQMVAEAQRVIRGGN